MSFLLQLASWVTFDESLNHSVPAWDFKKHVTSGDCCERAHMHPLLLSLAAWCLIGNNKANFLHGIVLDPASFTQTRFAAMV